MASASWRSPSPEVERTLGTMKTLILVAEAFTILAAWASFAAVSLTSPATPITIFYKGVGLAPLAVPAV
ncbi:MAG: hypothetical protein RXO54_05990 [Acidilobus sp.]